MSFWRTEVGQVIDSQSGIYLYLMVRAFLPRVNSVDGPIKTILCDSKSRDF